MSAFSVYNASNLHAGYLQTSPEYAMKRLLATGSGDIYQLAKAFRAEEKGKHHEPEFTLLEWYRLGFGIKALMQEVYTLIISLLGEMDKVVFSYRKIFLEILNFDPFLISNEELEIVARKMLGDIPVQLLRDNYLTLLFSEIIEPSFASEKIIFIYHYPESQASLAKIIEQGGFKVAERFEVYCGGLELANGFHELTDPKEQLSRFEKDNQTRKRLNYPQVEIDHRLIEALEQGLPECSGVALGVDRLLMLKLRQSNIANVLPLGAS